MEDPDIEAKHTPDTAADSLDSNEDRAPEAAMEDPGLMQPQLTFVANIDNNGGPITGSFVYMSSPSEPSSLTGPISHRSDDLTMLTPNEPRTRQHHRPHTVRNETPVNMDPFLALLQNQSSGYGAPPPPASNDATGMSSVSPLTQPTATPSPAANDSRDEGLGAAVTPPVLSFRTRRRKRNEQQRNEQQQNQRHNNQNQPQQQPQLPPHHRATNTQVWTGGDTSREREDEQAFVFNGVPIIFTSSSSQNNGTPSTGQRHSLHLPLGGGPQHRRTDTNMTLVSHDMVRGSSHNLPSVHILRGGTEGLRDHLHHIVRNSRRMQLVNDEQIERIKMMHQRFAEGSRFSFNYNTLLLTASVLAGLGLASNSSTTIIASMLVSPIMGPVVGMAYGATIHDARLFKEALKTELLSLLYCIFMGVVLTVCIAPLELSSNWPTGEMLVRGTWQNFFVALPVAFFSGLGVAVGLLDDQVSSLVGVAISASLLPPAVNSGILWTSYAFLRADWLVIEHPNLPDPNDPPEETVNIPDRSDFRLAGGISLSLTLSNIVLVAIASMIMFRLKERLPIPSKKIFWEDLGVARKIYRNLAVMEDSSEMPLQTVIRSSGSHSSSSSSSSNSSNPPGNGAANTAETMYDSVQVEDHTDRSDGQEEHKFGHHLTIPSDVPEGNEEEESLQFAFTESEV